MSTILAPGSIDPGAKNIAVRLRDVVAWGEPWDYEDDDVEDTSPADS